MSLCAAPGLFVLAAALAGVSDPQTARVSGAVTLDGVPVADGTIEFYSAASGRPVGGGAIVKGAFSVRAVPGGLAARICSRKVVGKQKRYDTPDQPVTDIIAETIPDRYNTKSTLRVMLIPGASKIDFSLVGR